MTGVLVNTGVIILGSLIGLLINKGLPERLTDTVMSAVGLCTVYIGVSGILNCQKEMVLIISMAVGAFLGALLDLDGRLNRTSQRVADKFKAKNSDNKAAQGFVNATLLFCVGAMAIVGSLDAGLSGDNSTLFAKSVLDGISSILFSATFGIGVIFAALPVFLYQGAIVLLSEPLSRMLTEAMITEIAACGSLMIVAIGLNVLNATKIKTANLLPALIIVPILCFFI